MTDYEKLQAAWNELLGDLAKLFKVYKFLDWLEEKLSGNKKGGIK